MTMVALKTHPKIYWIWNHRKWCLENIPAGPGAVDEENANEWRKSVWENDLFVVERMLDVDARNCEFLFIRFRRLISIFPQVHAWNYRRYILANTPKARTPKSELVYTKQKILSNFSNFSAWHQRSKVLSSLWTSGKLDESKSKEKGRHTSNHGYLPSPMKLNSEFELIRDAMYTDPHDQSVWIYHRWLVGNCVPHSLSVLDHHLNSTGSSHEILEREIKSIHELLDEQPDSKCR